MANPVPDYSAANLRIFLVARITARACTLRLEAFERRGEHIRPGLKLAPGYQRRAADHVRKVVCRDAGIGPAKYEAALDGTADRKTRLKVWRALGVEVLQ
jgi:hypothetical protein